jgi:hypothetical protein
MSNALTISEINNYPPGTYNQLFPATMTEISPLHKIMVNIVKINTDLAAKEIYKQKNGEYSLTKIGCLKLITAANVVMEESKPILPQGCQRCIEVARATHLAPQCNGCMTKQDVAHQVSILVPEPSGGHRRYIATKEVTKEDTLAKKNPLEHMGANCETKALLRAGRAGLGLKGSYTLGELEKPFAVALVVPNAQDPDMRAALIARYAAGQDALFGGGVTTLPSNDRLALEPGGVNGEVMVLGPDPDDNQGANDTPVTGKTQCCVECGLIIEPVGEWTVEMIVEGLVKKFGRVICSACQTKLGGGQA